VLLPPNGFLVESLDFMVFHALAWRGMTYDPVCPAFHAAPLDGKFAVGTLCALALEIEAGPVHSTG
jgi:hypothetical protein